MRSSEMRAGPETIRTAECCCACCACVSESGRNDGLMSVGGRLDGVRRCARPGSPGLSTTTFLSCAFCPGLASFLSGPDGFFSPFFAAAFFSSAFFASIFFRSAGGLAVVVEGLGSTGLTGGGSECRPGWCASRPSAEGFACVRGSLCWAVLSAAFGSGRRTSTGPLRAAPEATAKLGSGAFFS